MKNSILLSLVTASSLALGVANASSSIVLMAQTIAAVSESEALKLSALEALMSAPAERALPLVKKVLEANNSQNVKERALFVLSQLRGSEASALLLRMANDDRSPLQLEAIRMVGIRGDTDGLESLAKVYGAGNAQVRDGVLQAYLIADKDELVLSIAQQAKTDEEFESAVRTLAAMGATDALRQLSDKAGSSEGLLQAYAISGDLDSLLGVVKNSTDPEQRLRAIRNIGIVDGDKAETALTEIYRKAKNPAERDAALQGLLISGHDKGVYELYRSSKDPAEKRRLLQTLMHMDSDLAMDLIDSALQGDK